jgi:hypothetical protein
VSDVDRVITASDLQDSGGKRVATLRKGKKNYVKLVVE